MNGSYRFGTHSRSRASLPALVVVALACACTGDDVGSTGSESDATDTSDSTNSTGYDDTTSYGPITTYGPTAGTSPFTSSSSATTMTMMTGPATVTTADPTDATSSTTDASETETGTDTGVMECTPCDPDSAVFSQDFIAQAGISFDFIAKLCEALSGAPPDDRFVLDDFGDTTLSGSGSNLEVLSLSHGTFQNMADFYLLENLPFDTDIDIAFDGPEGMFETSFNVIAGEQMELTKACTKFPE